MQIPLFIQDANMNSPPATPRRDAPVNGRNFKDPKDRRRSLEAPSTPVAISSTSSTPVGPSSSRFYCTPDPSTTTRSRVRRPAKQVPQIAPEEPRNLRFLLDPRQWLAWLVLSIIGLIRGASAAGLMDRDSGRGLPPHPTSDPGISDGGPLESRTGYTDLDDLYETSESRAEPVPEPRLADFEERPGQTRSDLADWLAETSRAPGRQLPYSSAIIPPQEATHLRDDDPPPDYASRAEMDERDEEEVRRSLSAEPAPSFASASASDRTAAVLSRPTRHGRSADDLSHLQNELAHAQLQPRWVRGLAEDVHISTEQESARREMRERESGYFRGGILQFSAKGDVLLVALRVLDAKAHQSMTGRTLIVCFPEELDRWKASLSKIAPGLRIYVHRGSHRATNGNELPECDIVLTSYKILQQERSTALGEGRGHHSALFQVMFDRLVCDECQRIPKPDAKTFEACLTVNALYKWLLAYRKLVFTGEPIQMTKKKDGHDVFFELLAVVPRGYEERREAILEYRCLNEVNRRPSAQDGPPDPVLKIRLLLLDDAEWPFYQWTWAAIVSRIKLVLRGDIQCDDPTEYGYILLCRMVQACCQPNLHITEQRLTEFGEAACLQCLTLEPRKTFESGLCISCMNALDHIPDLKRTDPFFDKRAPLRPSTKLKGLAKLLNENFHNSGGKGKVVICSQLVQYLDFVLHYVENLQTGFAVFDLTTDPDSPTWMAALQNFWENTAASVVLLPTDLASTTDIDLSMADNIIFLDVLVDPDMEDRCVDVIRRAGKTTPVTVWKLLMADTIEVELQELQSKKRNKDGPNLVPEGHSYAGLTLQDLAEATGLPLPRRGLRLPRTLQGILVDT